MRLKILKEKNFFIKRIYLFILVSCNDGLRRGGVKIISIVINVTSIILKAMGSSENWAARKIEVYLD